MYQLVTSTCSLEGQKYTAFGIRCDEVAIEDVTLNRTAMQSLVDLCNEASLSCVHLFDVVENFLSSPSCCAASLDAYAFPEAV